ncbi:MAG TPA: YCF48-related protein, partial [Blastocatellia bacterium]|nr:YCF48-related protein [Blastocatellia bacterium]
MHTYYRGRLLAVILLLSIPLAGCTDGSQNNDQQNANAGPTTGSQKAAHWVAQFRSPSSANVQGTNLGFFSYSAISVVSQSTVFVAGDMPFFRNSTGRIGVIVRTTDGGKSWDEKPIEQPGMEIQTLNSIHFVDPQNGWAVGLDSNDQGLVLRTTDGGQNWTISKLNFKQHPTVVYFADAQTGWMGGSTPMPGQDSESEGGPSDILSTTDGGATWAVQRRVPVSILDFSFIDKMQGWASGFRGVIYHTTDGGRTWSQQRSELEMGAGIVSPDSEGAKKFMITAIQFIDPQNGWA